MSRTKPPGRPTSPEAIQSALDVLDIIGRWEWDASTRRVRVEGFVALLFNVDPVEAEAGAPSEVFDTAIHPDDRERVGALVRRHAREGSPFLTEYRVLSADGQTRWVLSRGRFTCDAAGRPLHGSGFLVDITQMRLTEGTFAVPDALPAEALLERAAEHAIAAQEAVAELQDAALKARADALLMELGRRLAQQEVQERRTRRTRMN